VLNGIKDIQVSVDDGFKRVEAALDDIPKLKNADTRLLKFSNVYIFV
jgi:hypothetical protein